MGVVLVVEEGLMILGMVMVVVVLVEEGLR